MGCEVVTGNSMYKAIEDQEMIALDPQHLYTHNHIQAPKGFAAVYAWGNGTIAFFHKSVTDPQVGEWDRLAGVSAMRGAGYWGIGWNQSDFGMGVDAYGNVRFSAPQLPDPWKD